MSFETFGLTLATRYTTMRTVHSIRLYRLAFAASDLQLPFRHNIFVRTCPKAVFSIYHHGVLGTTFACSPP
jgi:hypothetical protein